MQIKAENAIHVQIAIAITSLIVMPIIGIAFRDYLAGRKAKRLAELAAIFAPRDDIDKKHQENKALLEAIRLDGKEREGRMVASIEATQVNQRAFEMLMHSQVEKVNGHVMDVLKMLGNRRKE